MHHFRNNKKKYGTAQKYVKKQLLSLVSPVLGKTYNLILKIQAFPSGKIPIIDVIIYKQKHLIEKGMVFHIQIGAWDS